jgi:outer membrane protein assembly factor BamB
MRLLLVCLLSCIASVVTAGDWPQILGPARNGQAQGEKLPASAKPTIAWRAGVGAGYAGPAIAEGKVVIFHRVGDRERVSAFELTSGEPLWKTDFEASYQGGIDPDLGPRSVPTIDNGHVYVFGAAADLHCVALATGEKVWSRALGTDYNGPELLGYFGAGSSPIVAGDRVWVNLGGKDAGLVALDPANGKTVYKGTAERASYSSPTLATVNRKPSLIFVTRYNCLGIDPKTGAAQFTFAFGKRGPTVNAATPLVFDDRLFVSASYGVGAKLLRFTTAEPEVVWENDESMSSQYTTCVYRDGFLYGTAGREDVGDASLRCIEAATGDVKWNEDGYGIAHVILVGDQLLIVRQAGEIVVAPASPKSFKPTAKAKLVDGTIRALPAFSQGKLLLRTVATGDKGELICIGL